jgi:hypothetical protein
VDLRAISGDLLKTKAFLSRMYQPMPEEEAEFLLEYGDLEKQGTANLQRHTEKIRWLEQECLSRGLLPKQASPRGTFQYDADSRGDIQLGDEKPRGAPERKTLVHGQFHILLSDPVHLLDSFPRTAQQSLRMAISLPPTLVSRQRFIDHAAREYNIQSLIDEVEPLNKSDYINRWLLHKLRLSVMEVLLLFSTFRVTLNIHDIERWQQDVLHFWSRDKAANLPPSQFKSVYEDDLSGASNNRKSKTLSARISRAVSDPGQHLSFVGSW